MKKHLRSLIALTLSGISILAAQRVDDTRLKQVILFGRHGVRAPLLPDSTLNHFSAQPFPVFGVAGGNLTANGKTNETNLGSYFRLWLTKQNLLTGDDVADAAFVYCRTSTAALHMDTAKAFWAGMLPAAGATIDTSTGVDPLFDPLDAGVARLINGWPSRPCKGAWAIIRKRWLPRTLPNSLLPAPSCSDTPPARHRRPELRWTSSTPQPSQSN